MAFGNGIAVCRGRNGRNGKLCVYFGLSAYSADDNASLFNGVNGIAGFYDARNIQRNILRGYKTDKRISVYIDDLLQIRIAFR